MLYFLPKSDYSVTNNLYFSIPSPFSPIPPATFPSGNHQNVLCIYEPASVLLALLFCFLDLVVDIYVCIAILLFIFLIFLFFLKKDPLTFHIILDSFSFFLSEKLFMCSSIRNDSFAGQSSNLGCRSLLFTTLNVSHHSLLACKISVEKSANGFMELSCR